MNLHIGIKDGIVTLYDVPLTAYCTWTPCSPDGLLLIYNSDSATLPDSNDELFPLHSQLLGES